MFRENKTSIQLKEIDKIIDLLDLHKDLECVRNCYGIITYFRKNKLKEVEFAHKSIFEYYIACKIYNQLVRIMRETDGKRKIQMLQAIFSKNVVTKEIFCFLDGFIDKNFEDFKLCDLDNTMRFIINLNVLFEDYGYFKNFSELYNCFCNSFNCLVKIISKKKKGDLIDVLNKCNQQHFSFFLRNKTFDYLYMKKFDLSNKCFSRLLFKNANLSESNMRNSDFSYCDFSEANLEACDLTNANFFSVILNNTNLCCADLRGTNLNNAKIKKEAGYFINTKIHICQLKYFWPEITMFYQCFQIYTDDVNLASEKEIEFEFDKIRGFHLGIQYFNHNHSYFYRYVSEN